jgi:hypothetical protein
LQPSRKEHEVELLLTIHQVSHGGNIYARHMRSSEPETTTAKWFKVSDIDPIKMQFALDDVPDEKVNELEFAYRTHIAE